MAVYSTITSKLATDGATWLSLHNKNKNIGDSIWRTMHTAHKVMKYWENIPSYEERDTCPICENAQTGSIGIIWCSSESIRNAEDVSLPGASRLMKILISESARLKLYIRCK